MSQTHYTWLVPGGLVLYNVEGVAAGGGGQNGGTGTFYGSSGGGGYSNAQNLTSVPGHTYDVFVGDGGAAGSANGGDTDIRGEGGPTVCLAKGGQITGGTTGGAGGAAAGGTGDVKWSGGAGGNGDVNPLLTGGAGGGAPAGIRGDGGAGGNGGASPGAAGTAAYQGVAGAAGTSGTGNAGPCGGGGAGCGVSFNNGGRGGDGWARVWDSADWSGGEPIAGRSPLFEWGCPPPIITAASRAYAFIM